MANRKWGAGLLVLAALAIGAGIAAVVIFNRKSAPMLTSEQARELIHLKNVGLGALENQKLPEALAAFEKIGAAAPTDPLGPRNIAAARVLALGVELEPAPAADVEAAQAAVSKLLEIEGETAASHWLGMRLAAARPDLPAATAHIDALLQQKADDAAAWYAKFRLLRIASPQKLDPQAAAALDKALALSPSNVWLLVEWLRVFAGEISDAAADGAAGDALQTRFGPLADTLEKARASVQPFAHIIQAHARVDAPAMLDQAVAALRAGEWTQAATRMRPLANVLLPHSATDQLPLRKHPLEFVLHEFRPEFYQQAGVAEIEQEPAIQVAFAASENWQLPDELLQPLGEIHDIALADFDIDGRTDVILLGSQAVAVFGRPAAEPAWKQLASAPVEGMSRLIAQDLDADFDETRAAAGGEAADAPLRDRCPTADVDLALAGSAGMRLFENRHAEGSGERTLVPIDSARLPTQNEAVQAFTCGDVNADGDLDLVLATPSGLQLWTNNGDWTFTDSSSRSALPEKLSDVAQLVALDWDRDIDIDVLVAAPSGGGWLENLRHGQFRWQPFATELPLLQSSVALAVTDADGNASWDVAAAGTDGLRLVLAVGASQPAAIAPLAATNILTWDYDNDGFEDLLAWSDRDRKLFRGVARSKFEAADLLPANTDFTRAAADDLDGDGDEDLAIVAAGKVQLLFNEGGNKNHWLDVALQGQQIKGRQLSPSGRVSPYGVGSLLELKAGFRYQARVVAGQSTHFGLGKETTADVVRVGWLNGVPQNILEPAADAFVCEQQVLNTSCPYLYAWDGERFVFVTDLLWNAPLGLQLAEGQLAPWRDWEYVKIPGRQLAARDGHYDLQVTAELWEADYFDQIKLIAVDHPANVEVYSNEKVGPPEMAQFKIHTVTNPRSPVAVRTDRGRDLLPAVASEDGNYAQTFDRKLRQGIVEEHGFEIDLGNLGSASEITLFLTGWYYPAATSLNVALSQGGTLGPARPPSLEVADEDGQWKTVLPFMGFPGGKTKTIAIPLQPETWNLKPEAPVRLRISTSMELYWDHIFFSVDEPAAEIRTTELKLASADLHERGFSRVVRDEGNGPEQFLYDQCSTAPKWPPMLGHFTRFGDVRELLTERDDRLLVMGAGDETTLRFAMPPEPLPDGWKRDFLLYSVGWDKDANLETIAGQSSEPLPFADMRSYPWPADQDSPDSSGYRDYQRQYQTRLQSAAYWQAVRSNNSVPRP
jgi:tetratricopeptide (TPR) repeat protein